MRIISLFALTLAACGTDADRGGKKHTDPDTETAWTDSYADELDAYIFGLDAECIDTGGPPAVDTGKIEITSIGLPDEMTVIVADNTQANYFEEYTAEQTGLGEDRSFWTVSVDLDSSEFECGTFDALDDLIIVVIRDSGVVSCASTGRIGIIDLATLPVNISKCDVF